LPGHAQLHAPPNENLGKVLGDLQQVAERYLLGVVNLRVGSAIFPQHD